MKLLHVLIALGAVLSTAVAAGAVPASAEQLVAQAANPQPSAAGTIAGTATDAAGAPLAGVTIKLNGPTKTLATTDANGHYALANLVPGLYTITAVRPGYNATAQSDLSVLPGTSLTANVTLTQATLSSLREIGRTSVSSSRSSFNASPAAVQVISAQAFRDQQQPQVARILDQTPGIVSSLPGGVNNASPGAITFPNIRGRCRLKLRRSSMVTRSRWGSTATTSPLS